jgi:tetratricopeptide (TPR) repeat protein
MLTAEDNRPVCSSAMTCRSLSLPLITLFVWVTLTLVACQSAALQANQAQVEQQQRQIEQMQEQIEEIKAQNASHTSPPASGSCDHDVMAQATRQGGDKFAAGDFSGALGYYHDALTACPGNARAELNVGRAYEALNDKGQAMAHYQSAASSSDPGESAAETEAHKAIDRLGASPR